MSDLIKREDAVKTVIRKCSPICAWQVGTQQYPDCVVAEINALPSADAEWIPVSERLPSVGEDVLFCDSEWTEEGCLRADGDWWQFRWSTVMPKEKVTAWMPLPTPYKGGDTE